MRKIQAKPLSAEAFKRYGSYYDTLHPEGNHLGDFYQDPILMAVSGQMSIGFSTFVATKLEKMIITAAEYHNTTSEGILPLDDAIIIHVAPPSVDPVPDLTEAFIIPKGTMVVLNTGVWHFSPLPLHKQVAHVLITLPERTYFNDCTVVDYKEEEYFEITLS